MFYLLGTPRHQMHATHTFGEVRFPESSLQKGLPHILNTPLKMHHLVRQRSAEAADPKKSFLFVFLCTCACWSMCVLGCACVHVCVCVHIQRSTFVYLSQYTSHLAFFFLIQDFSLHQWPSLAVQWTPGILLAPTSPALGSCPNFYMATRYLNSASHACTTNILPTELFPKLTSGWRELKEGWKEKGEK